MGEEGGWRRPVSRVLSSVATRTVIPLGARSPAPSSSLPAASWSGRAVPRCLFGLAPTGVCRATNVAARAVSSYLTVSPLPVSDVRTIGGLLSVALSVGAHHPAQALPGSAPCGARTFLEHEIYSRPSG